MLNRFKKTVRSKTGSVFAIDAETKVSKDGVFSIAIPDELEPICRKLHESQHPRLCFFGASRGSPERRKTLLQAARLSDIEALLAQAAEIYVNGSQETSNVLVYRIVPQCAYAVASGRIFRNGYEAQKAGFSEYEWRGTLDGSSAPDIYSLGIAAGVFVKTVDRFAGLEKIHYACKSFPNFSDLWGARLNAYIGLECDPKMCTGEIPYSEEHAKFFCDLLMSLVAMIDKTTTYLATPARVLEAIETRKGRELLLLGGVAPHQSEPEAP